MDKQYQDYCLTHPLFYDSPQSGGKRTYFPVARRPLPRGWKRRPNGEWTAFHAPGYTLPGQGWKIHVSACVENAAETLAQVWEYCVPRGISFKIIGSPAGVRMRNVKYAARPGSGKAATVYPADDRACERILRELDARLDGAAGPYILSDLRYGAGPLYVRYGGFTRRYCKDSSGEPVLAIENPAGELVPDTRSPAFSVPEWVTIPDFLAPHLAARNSVAISNLNYEITGALHFSNGGGVYAGTDKRDGRKVILKEARPHAGLAADGSDAVARLRREYDAMRRLSGLGIAPEALDYFQVDDHHFLVEEFIEGRALYTAVADRYPLASPDPDPESLAEFTSWAMEMCTKTECAAELMHSRGIVFNDLHPHNVMVRDDGSVAFIDFEAATDADEGRRMTVANPAFAAPRDRSGFGVDAYSLACVRLAVFMPLTTLLQLDRTKASQIAGEIAALFGVPRPFLDDAVAEIERGAPPRSRTASSATGGFSAGGRPAGALSADASASGAHDAPIAVVPRQDHSAGGIGLARDEEQAGGAGATVWGRLSAELTAAIRASATPDRTDRLFPGDIDQFRIPGGGLSLAYGAAGVLFALDEAAGLRVPEYEEWLLRRVKNPPADVRLGCYDGMAGVAWTLGRLGHRDAAVRLAGMCLAEKWELLGHGLFDGLPGFGLAMLDLAETTAEPGFAAAGLRAAGILADAARRDAAAGRTAAGASVAGRENSSRGDASSGKRKSSASEGLAGLMHGGAGRALLCIRAYERTADPGYLDAAAAAIAADLDRTVPDRIGGLQVNEGWRLMPYLKDGSAGIGMVIDQFLAHRPNPEFAAAAQAIGVAATSTFYVQSGLFSGRAGLLAFLAARDRTSPRVRDHVARLAWHAMPYSGGLAFPGDMLFRLAMDLGTGTAGVLLGLAAALAPHGAAVPFLARRTDLPDRDRVIPQPVQGVNEDRELARR